MKIQIEQLSRSYRVRRLTEQDVASILELERGNSLYYQYSPPAPSQASVVEDMQALPVGKTMADKYFLGFFQGRALVTIVT
ncbi:hypothetical protein J2T50_001924 [Streptococcus gallinaceus]|uniref:GNAT family acetyltransferase n=1 Tax=Streptococcus gallinaceus TaxID=165758 RepID=UPI0020A1D06B|nr:GNAT family acetyltransferase [Streptococcus gallinaceus]MCP1640198.1 hypothetical protein [Streptococcus gallinaceus]MCP1771018.1 hypothetical protein [Streptococcus gallinaceus]